MTSKEALEELYDGYQYGMAGRSFYDLVKQDLERLKVLEQENKDLKEIIEIRKQMNINLIDFGTKLKQENEKLKKVIKIIKRMDIFLNQDEDFKDGSIEICGYLEVSEEVFELLKEVLGDAEVVIKNE